jgi:alpha-ketoglutarate-dependent taurine dioxygenase
VAEQLRRTNPDEFNTLLTTPITFHYKDASNSLQQTRPIIQLDEYGEMKRFIYNNDDRSAVYMPPDKAQQYYEALFVMMQQLYSPKNEFRVKLKPGMLLATNNWRVLHGREAFTGSRRLAGCYISMDQFWSKTRMLQEHGLL